MDWQVGEILEGKVSGITKFGAFVALPGGKSGLVHISEVANAFVSDVSEHVQIGQTTAGAAERAARRRPCPGSSGDQREPGV